MVECLYMEITWYGQSFFEIKTRDNEKNSVSLIIDPFDEKTGLKVPNLESQILLVSHSHSDHSNIKAIKGGYFLIQEPGEYEIKNVLIKAIPSFHDNSQGKEDGPNIIFKIEAEGLKICHLGDLGQKELDEEQLEQIGEVDVLIIPVGASHVIAGKEAAEIVSQIEPKMIIPMHYKIPKLKYEYETAEKFLKTMGAEGIQPQKKIKISAKDMAGEKEEAEIVILEP